MRNLGQNMAFVLKKTDRRGDGEGAEGGCPPPCFSSVSSLFSASVSYTHLFAAGAGRAAGDRGIVPDGRPFRCGRGNRGRFRARGGAGAGTVRRRGTSSGGDTAPRGVLRRSRTPCANGAGRFGAGIGGRAGGNGPVAGMVPDAWRRCSFARRGGGFLRPRGQRPDAACLGPSQAPGIGGAGGGSRRLAGVRALFAFRGLLLRG